VVNGRSTFRVVTATAGASQAWRSWIAVVGAAVFIAACGSTDAEPDPTPTPTPTATAGEPAAEATLEQLPEVPEATASRPPPSSQDAAGESAFLTAVFDDAQAMWEREFDAAGLRYVPAQLTVFRDAVQTACGAKSASVGPFYCPADRGVYLDTRFFDALSRSVGVRLGDLAQAYVVAHEVAHHVQMLLGILQRVRMADLQDPGGENARSVRVELQADCLAGVWKHSRYQRGQLTPADFEEALRAAAVVGDDFQQQRATGTITPEDWTHGSSRQRQHWLTTGFDEGKPAACDTFGA
jgi:predicted metalloprotease